MPQYVYITKSIKTAFNIFQISVILDKRFP